MRQDHSRGPRALLADRFDELWRAAGSPTLSTVAREAQESPRILAKSKITAQKISAWKTGTNVPESLPVMESVVRVLIQMARRTGFSDTSPELLDERQWPKWWREARSFSPLRPGDKLRTPGQIIDDRLNPFDLEVHRAISDESREFTLELPAYIEREHDSHLRIIVDRAQTQSTLAVLVGGSSTGKTRSCWEAVQRLEGWRLWHPINPNRFAALLIALKNNLVAPKTVLWLNEMQYYLGDSESGAGEAVAAGLREILRDRTHAPILVLGTLWPEYWDALTRRPVIGQAADNNLQCRELLSGHRIKVPDGFDEIDVTALPDVVKADDRVMQALDRPDRRVTQFLAGAFELLSKYETASAAPRALIDVAVDASRFGLGNTVRETLLRNAVPGYLTDYEWNELDDDEWFSDALTYVRRPCLGISGPLAKIRSRSRNSASAEACYRLADFLDDNGRRSRKFCMPPETFWSAITDLADSPGTLIDLAYELQYRGRYRNAARLYLMAADAGETDGLIFLADNRRRAGDNGSAEEVLKIAAGQGSLIACIDLAELRAKLGDTEAAKLLLKNALVDLSTESEDRSFAWHRLVNLCEETGDIRNARNWLRQAVKDGDESAADELTRLSGKSKDSETLTELQKAAAGLRQARRQLLRSETNIIRHSLANAESFSWALRHYADMMEDGAGGRCADALIMLGRVHDAHGNYDNAKEYFLKAINFLNGPYEYGVIPALVELYKMLKRKGDTDAASRLWRYGLELDGSIAEAWTALDQLPRASP